METKYLKLKLLEEQPVLACHVNFFEFDHGALCLKAVSLKTFLMTMNLPKRPFTKCVVGMK